MQTIALRTVSFVIGVSAIGLAALAGSLNSNSASANSPKAPALTLEQMKAEYRRPEAIPFPKSNPYSVEKASLGKSSLSIRGCRRRTCCPAALATARPMDGAMASRQASVTE